MSDAKINYKPSLLTSLLLSNFSIYPASVLTSLLLIEMAASFNTSVGTVSQIRTVSSLLGFVSALVMSVLSIRYKSRDILLVGLAILALSAFGTAVSGSLLMLFLIYPLNGLASNMVFPMIISTVGENYVFEHRPKVVGWIGSSGGLSFMISAICVTALASTWGWRGSFILYVGLIPLAALFMVWRNIPRPDSVMGDETSILGGVRAILSSRSACSSLAVSLIIGAASQSIYFFSFTYIREVFMLNRGATSLISSFSSLLFLLGSFFCGAAVDYLGLKAVSTWSLFLALISTFLYINLPFSLSIASILAGHFFLALQYSANNTLFMEQLPEYRGSMMSLVSSISFLGYSFGTAIGGMLLVSSGWIFFDAVFGALTLSGLAILHFLVERPVKCNKFDNKN